MPAAYLSHRTGIAMLSVDHSSGEVGFGDELLDKLAAKIGAGCRILIVDDINDSGGTIAYLRAAIDGKSGDPAALRIAVLVHNVRSKARVEYHGSEIDRDLDKTLVRLPLGSGGAAHDAQPRRAGGARTARLAARDSRQSISARPPATIRPATLTHCGTTMPCTTTSKGRTSR